MGEFGINRVWDPVERDMPAGLPKLTVNIKAPALHPSVTRLEIAVRMMEVLVSNHRTYVSNKDFTANEAVAYTDALLKAITKGERQFHDL